MTNKNFYAASHHYGVDICNDFATLYRFSTKAERDQFVDEQQDRESVTGSIRTEAQTRGEARRHFKNAFRMVGDFHDESDERDWIPLDNGGEYWEEDNIYRK